MAASKASEFTACFGGLAQSSTLVKISIEIESNFISLANVEHERWRVSDIAQCDWLAIGFLQSAKCSSFDVSISLPTFNRNF